MVCVECIMNLTDTKDHHIFGNQIKNTTMKTTVKAAVNDKRLNTDRLTIKITTHTLVKCTKLNKALKVITLILKDQTKKSVNKPIWSNILLEYRKITTKMIFLKSSSILRLN